MLQRPKICKYSELALTWVAGGLLNLGAGDRGQVFISLKRLFDMGSGVWLRL